MILESLLYPFLLLIFGSLGIAVKSGLQCYIVQSPFKREKSRPQWYPYLIPMVGHSFQLIMRPRQFMQAINETSRLRIPTANPFIIVEPRCIRKFFKTTPSSNPALVQKFVGGDLFGMPKKASATFINDLSGRDATPKPGTSMELRNRVCHLDHDIIHSMLKGEEAPEILQRLIESIYKRMDDLQVTYEWQEELDLFQFYTSIFSPAMIQTFFGPLLTEQIDTQFVTTFWTFDSWVAAIAKRAPRWLFPQGFRARDRLIDSLKRWRKLTAELAANGQQTGACKGIMRKLDLLKADDWDMDSLAATDLGFIASFNSNPIPTMFWLGYEVIRRPSLLAELRAECRECVISESSSGRHLRFNVSALRGLPLLQSSIAEALRLRTHVFTLRYPDQDDLVIGEWRIPKRSLVMACSTTSHMNPNLWNTGPFNSRPVEEFWAERFIYQPRGSTKNGQVERRFSSRGLEGVWLPFGGGAQMCPGQLFSKTAISLATGFIVMQYDIELCHPKPEVPVNWSHFGAGVIRPGAKVPFRIRKRYDGCLEPAGHPGGQ